MTELLTGIAISSSAAAAALAVLELVRASRSAARPDLAGPPLGALFVCRDGDAQLAEAPGQGSSFQAGRGASPRLATGHLAIEPAPAIAGG